LTCDYELSAAPRNLKNHTHTHKLCGCVSFVPV
jgi:hypothetical protein